MQLLRRYLLNNILHYLSLLNGCICSELLFWLRDVFYLSFMHIIVFIFYCALIS